MNNLEVMWGGRTFVFVSDDGLYPIEKALEYLQENYAALDEVTDTKHGEGDVDEWEVADNPQSRRIFQNDLRSGIEFCVKKYGQSAEAIQAEAARQNTLRLKVHS